jgi:hypothetical protein
VREFGWFYSSRFRGIIHISNLLQHFGNVRPHIHLKALDIRGPLKQNESRQVTEYRGVTYKQDGKCRTNESREVDFETLIARLLISEDYKNAGGGVLF